MYDEEILLLKNFQRWHEVYHPHCVEVERILFALRDEYYESNDNVFCRKISDSYQELPGIHLKKILPLGSLFKIHCYPLEKLFIQAL